MMGETTYAQRGRCVRPGVLALAITLLFGSCGCDLSVTVAYVDPPEAEQIVVIASLPKIVAIDPVLQRQNHDNMPGS